MHVSRVSRGGEPARKQPAARYGRTKTNRASGPRAGFGRLARLAPAAGILLAAALAPAQGGHPDLAGPRLVLTGITVADDGSSHILVGQLITASAEVTVSVPPLPGYKWTVSDGGRPFNNYQPSTASATYTPFTYPTGSSGSWYFAHPASVLITCVVTPGSGKPITVSAYVTVDGPTYALSGAGLGTATLYSTPPPRNGTDDPPFVQAPPPPFNGVALWFAQIPNEPWQWGALWYAAVTTPTTPAYGAGGTWNFTNLVVNPTITFNQNAYKAYWFTQPGNPPVPIWPSPLLDCQYPTQPLPPATSFPATSQDQLYSDAPGCPIQSWMTQIQYSSNFQTYILYTPPVCPSLPPPPPGGPAAAVPVPIEEMTWQFAFSATGSPYSWICNIQSPPTTGWSSYPTPFPTWSYCIPYNPPLQTTPPYPGE